MLELNTSILRFQCINARATLTISHTIFFCISDQFADIFSKIVYIQHINSKNSKFLIGYVSHKPTGGDKVSTRDGKTKFEISRFEICLMRPEEGRSHLPPPFSTQLAMHTTTGQQQQSSVIPLFGFIVSGVNLFMSIRMKQ